MGKDNKNYIYRDAAGEEHGPYDEATIQSLARNGTILPEFTVRSTLIPVWEKASDSRVLKKVLAGVLQQRAETIAKSSPWSQIMTRINRRGDYDPLAAQLAGEGITYDKASFLYRLLAGAIDLAIIFAGSFVLLFLCWTLMKAGILSSPAALQTFAMLTVIGAGLYYAILINRSGQTVGQRFWGIVVINDEHQPVYMCRALVFAVLVWFFGIISPVTWLLFGCKGTLQEKATGLKVRHITIARKSAA